MPRKSTSWPWSMGDRKLQKVDKSTISYFKNSLKLKEQLLKIDLPPNARLFSADAVSMYTNIPTHLALNLIGKEITQYKCKHNETHPADSIRETLHLVMTMNIFTFGDPTLKQLNGTAMGILPQLPYPTIYYGIHEERFLPKHSQRVVYYRRFIENVIRIWCPSVIFHLPFDPNDQTSYKIQQAWRDNIASPRYHMPLPNMRNPKTKEKCNIERMIIAYRRPMNIGNLLSHPNLNTNPTAAPVSS